MNATTYEAALFVNESTNMVAEGSYLFTIGIIPVTLDIGMVLGFVGAVIGTGTENVNFQAARGATVEQVVVSALYPLPVGVYTFNIRLAIFDGTDPVVSHVAAAEVRILPPPGKSMHALPCIVCVYFICLNGGPFSFSHFCHCGAGRRAK